MQATAAYDYRSLSERVRKALRDNFRPAKLRTSKGYLGRVHVLLRTEELNGLTEKAKQDLVWDVLKRTLGADAQGVSLVLPYGTDESED